MRSDYGDYPDDQLISNESDFLKMLAQFCHWEVMRNAGNQALPDIDFWRLIMRLANSCSSVWQLLTALSRKALAAVGDTPYSAITAI